MVWEICCIGCWWYRVHRVQTLAKATLNKLETRAWPDPVHNNPVTCDNYQPITCPSSSIQGSQTKESVGKRGQTFGEFYRDHILSPTTQCWNSWACLIGSWEGATGVFLSLLLMVYIPHLSHRGSPHHLPSSANCLTFQICLAPTSESLRCEMVITRRERKPGAGTWTRAEWNLKFQQNLEIVAELKPGWDLWCLTTKAEQKSWSCCKYPL